MVLEYDVERHGGFQDFGFRFSYPFVPMGTVERQLCVNEASRVVFFGRKGGDCHSFERRFRIHGNGKGVLRLEKHRANLRSRKFLGYQDSFLIRSGFRIGNEPVSGKRCRSFGHPDKDSGGFRGIGQHDVIERSRTEGPHRRKSRGYCGKLRKGVDEGRMGLSGRLSDGKGLDRPGSQTDRSSEQ